MGFWEDAVNTVERKSEEVVKISKLKFRISTIKNELNTCYSSLGRHIYQTRKNGVSDEQYEETLIRKIASLHEDLTSVTEELNRVKGARPCTKCGQVNEVANEFCSRCGTRL